MMWDMMAPMWWMWFLWVLVLVLIIAGIILVVRSLTGRSNSSQSNPSQDQNTAVRILQERHARGDIDEDEYGERRRVLDEKETRAD